MAEGPKIMRSDDGLYVRYEFDAHYVSDEAVQRIRGYIDQLQAENAKLRKLVEDLYFDLLGEMPESMLEDRRSQMRNLGIEVN